MNQEHNLIDPHVGARIRDYRKKLGWTLAELGEKLRISPQQMQKYEQGKTRVSAGILYKLSSIMALKCDYFFEGLEKKKPSFHLIPKNGIIPEERIRPMDVLLVENSPEDALITRKAIERSGVKVNFYLLHTGKQALSFLKNGQTLVTFPRPEIIILELNIPKGEGHLTLKEIKRDRRFCDIPVIVLANCAEREEMVKAYQNSAAGFIRKPVDFKEYCNHMALTLQYWSTVVTLPQMDCPEPPPLDDRTDLPREQVKSEKNQQSLPSSDALFVKELAD